MITIDNCNNRKCNGCECYCVIMKKEVDSRLERIKDKSTRSQAIKELQELFPEAGFTEERQRPRGVIKVDGEYIDYY